ncbi:unnamed protein product [Rotaria sp. Silwood1]|nr:unnamed protein product [Rotaria sp. Silwood1]
MNLLKYISHCKYVEGNAAFSSGFATLINAAIVLQGYDSLNTRTQVGIGIGITFLWAVQNALRIDQQGWLNNFAAFLQFGSTIVIVIVLLVMAPERATAHNVFTSTYNSTGFPFPYVCFIGILSTLFSFSGYEGNRCDFDAITGTVYLLALLFAIPNVTSFVENNSGINGTEDLAVATYRLAVPLRGALALTILLIINMYFSGMSAITTTSRIGFAMARDGVFPFSVYLRWIFKPTKTPIANVFFVFILDSLLLLLQLASTTAFTNMIAITALGFQISYFIPIFFRCTAARRTFVPREFNLGRFGLPIAIITSIWLFITSIIMFFPAEYPVTKDNMNYAVVIVGGIAVFATVYWIVSARHWFVGPKRTTKNPFQLLPVYITSTSDTKKTLPSPGAIHSSL